MLVIGVTGGIGSGKTAVTEAFERLGIAVVDADIAARAVVEKGTPALEKIALHFGQSILLPSGELDRAALRKLIFDNTAERKWLEQLTHPLIRDQIIRGLQNAKSPYVILASPLLIESGQYHLVKRTLVVDVPESLQIERTCKRDNNDVTQVQAIINAQLPRQKRLEHADDVICNNKDLAYLHSEVAKYHQQYLELV